MSDLTFTIDSYTNSGKRANGTLDWPAKGLSNAAVSGPYGNGFLPLGNYKAKRSELLDKTEGAYLDGNGKGWMQVIRPDFATDRTDLGIHPDGNVPGTEGCIGLTIVDSKPWFNAFKAASGAPLTLTVQNAPAIVSPDPPIIVNRRLKVLVSGSGKHRFEQTALPLGMWIAGQGHDLLVGGGNGVMESAAEGFCRVADRKGVVIGVIPGEYLSGHYASEVQISKGYPNRFIEIPIQTHLPGSSKQGVQAKLDPDSRNHLLVLSADLVVVVGGDEGTESEVVLAVSHERPVIFVEPISGWAPPYLSKPNVYQASDVTDLHNLLR